MKRKEIVMVAAIIVLVVLALLAIAVYSVSNMFAKVVVFPNTHDYDDSRKQVMNHCSIDPLSVLENHKVEEFTYKSEFGYNLYGRIIWANEDVKFSDGKQRAVILSHGWTSNHITMLTYGKLYQEMGFTVIGFDHRYHGKSDKSVHCTMGLYESKDLVGLANFVRTKLPEDTIWGIQGESMGSASAMQAAPEIKWLSFLVEDCGFASMTKQMASTLDNKKLPHFPILNVGGAILKHRYGLDMAEVDATKAVAKLDIPMLLCQGDNDTFVPTKMIYDIYEAKKDNKRMQLFEGSKHAESIWDHTDQYRQVLKDFLTDFGIIPKA